MTLLKPSQSVQSAGSEGQPSLICVVRRFITKRKIQCCGRIAKSGVECLERYPCGAAVEEEGDGIL